jgi:hypothetical protein
MNAVTELVMLCGTDQTRVVLTSHGSNARFVL